MSPEIPRIPVSVPPARSERPQPVGPAKRRASRDRDKRKNRKAEREEHKSEEDRPDDAEETPEHIDIRVHETVQSETPLAI